MTDPAMAELARTREELRAALRKGVKGTRAEERIDHLVDEHQAAVKTVLAHRLAEQQRAFLRSKGTAKPPACRYCPDPLCPENCPECGVDVHDLDAVPSAAGPAATQTTDDQEQPA